MTSRTLKIILATAVPIFILCVVAWNVIKKINGNIKKTEIAISKYTGNGAIQDSILLFSFNNTFTPLKTVERNLQDVHGIISTKDSFKFLYLKHRELYYLNGNEGHRIKANKHLDSMNKWRLKLTKYAK